MPPELAVAALPLVAAFLVTGFRRPMALLLPAYAVTVPFGSLLSTGLSPPWDSVSTWLGFALVAALGARVLGGRSTSAPLPATVPVWLLFLGLAGASALWSVSPQITQIAFRNLAILVVLYVVVALTPIDRPGLRRIETAILLGGVAAAAYGIFQFVTGTLPVSVEGGGGGRFGRDLLGANNTAAALVLPLAVALVRAVDGPTVGVRRAHAAAGAALLFAILLTGSRGGLLAVAVCVVTALVVVREGRARLGRYAAVAVLAVGLVLVVQPGGIGSRTDSTSSSGRVDVWKVGLHACQTHCLAGSGWGTFPRVYQLELPKVPDARILQRGVAYEPHNIWILIGVEAGVGGLLLVLLGLGVTVRHALRLPPELRGPPLVALAGTLVASFFLSNFEYKFFWLTLTYVLLCRNLA
ncbi:MAG TPA: O-antigen ligase family protein, partial [Actinoplanes sp.]|nr:O-antigen ligase family protein [Actinoplanes sp.]